MPALRRIGHFFLRTLRASVVASVRSAKILPICVIPGHSPLFSEFCLLPCAFCPPLGHWSLVIGHSLVIDHWTLVILIRSSKIPPICVIRGHSPLSSEFCLLSSAFCLLPSAFCLLSSVYWPLTTDT